MYIGMFSLIVSKKRKGLELKDLNRNDQLRQQIVVLLDQTVMKAENIFQIADFSG